MANANDDDVIIICRDDHQFTHDYNRNFLFHNILEANKQGIEYLTGCVENFHYAYPITTNRFWVYPNSSSRFIFLYKRAFAKILATPYSDEINTWELFARTIKNSMVVYPFISAQNEDTKYNEPNLNKAVKDFSKRQFFSFPHRLEGLKSAYLRYNANREQE